MNNKITFPRLASLLADKSGRSKRFSEDFLREFFALISETLEAQESVKIKGFGTFRLIRVESRRSVDVTTGAPIEISGHTKISFIPSKSLAEEVNAPFEAFSAVEIREDVDIESLFSDEELQFQNENEDISDDQDFENIDINSSNGLSLANTEDTLITFDNPPANFELVEEDDDFQVDEANDNIQEASRDIQAKDHLDIPDVNSFPHAPEKIVANTHTPPTDFFIRESFNNRTIQDISSSSAPDCWQDNTIEDNKEGNNDKSPIDAQKPFPDNSDKKIEIEEEIEEFEVKNSRKKNWIRGLLIVLGAAVVALFATFIIWYVCATNDFSNFFKGSDVSATADQLEGFVVGKSQPDPHTSYQAPGITADSAADSVQDIETEEETVPTSPSDVIVYDTISTTRYLTTMAKAHYGNYNLWPYIYQENQSFLGHPDRIRPGTPVVIPKLSKYGIDPMNSEDIEKAKKLGIEIYARYGKKI